MTPPILYADDRPRLTCRVTHEQHDAIKRACIRQGLTPSEFMRRAILYSLRHHKGVAAPDEAGP